MNIWKLVLGLDYRQIGRLSLIMLSNPLFVFPTLRATQRTIMICNEHYGKAHHGNGMANAYRHALWNMLICCHSFFVSKDKEKTIIWAKRITDIYEKIAINKPIEMAMDLHNNEQGRRYFEHLSVVSEKEVICFLNARVARAKKVNNSSDIEKYKNDLVYL